MAPLKKIFFIIIAAVIFISAAFALEKPSGDVKASSVSLPAMAQVEAVIGIKTVYSGGRYTVSQVAKIAAENGVGAFITADAFLNNWQYGLWPFRKIIKKTEETRSVSKYGIERYLDDVRSVQRAYPSMVIMAGLELAPFYRWQGNPFAGNFAIKDWHKHIIAIGIDRAADYRSLPVIGNGTSLAKGFGFKSIFYLMIPIAILAIGLFGLFNGIAAKSDVYERRAGLLLTQWRSLGIVLTVAGLILLFNGYPFMDIKYDQYHGDRGPVPYQNLIDYVKARGGMTFWSHPEAKNLDIVGKISIETQEHSDLMLQTRGYTGFAIFDEGYDIVGRPGGVWDNLLKEYCKLARRSPVWAIGTLDYEHEGSLNEQMRIIRTVLLVGKPGREGVLEAMRAGRMYVSKDADAPRFYIDNFTVEDISGTVSAGMGGEAAVTGPARIRMSGHFKGAPADTASPEQVKILLIKDGEPFKVFAEDAPFDISYDDEDIQGAGRHYYRAEIRSAKLFTVTNPIFINRR